MQKRVPMFILRLLYYWYKNQQLFIRWGSATSNAISVSNGVRQGGILSPILFNVYNDELSDQLRASNIGYTVGNLNINHFFYADDISLIAPTPEAMNNLLNICHRYGIDHDIIFNPVKSCCLHYWPRVSWIRPACTISMNNIEIPRVLSHKYLGHILSTEITNLDDADIKNQMKSLYARGNNLVKNFRSCSDHVKTSLFRSYCCAFYCSSLWWTYSSAAMHKMKMAYNRVFRNLMNLQRDSSISLNLTSRFLPSFESIIRNSVYSVRMRVIYCANYNKIVACFVNDRNAAFNGRVNSLYIT